MQIIRLGTVIAAILWLAACGAGNGAGVATDSSSGNLSASGSGSSSSTGDSTVSVSIQAGITSLVNSGGSRSFTLTGSINNSTATTTVAAVPLSGSGVLTRSSPVSTTLASGPLTGTTVTQSTLTTTGSLNNNGQVSSIARTEIEYFNPANFALLAFADGTTASYYASYVYPTTAKAGDSGTLGSATSTATLPTVTASTYSVAADTSTSLLVTFTDTATDASNGSTTVTQTVYRITTGGSASLVTQTVNFSLPGTTVESVVYTFT